MSFRVRGGAAETRAVFDNFRRIFRATDLGRIKTVATIPAISTHQQQGEEARDMADIPPNLIRLCVGGENPDDVLIRLCVGGENPDDVIEDLDRALTAAK